MAQAKEMNITVSQQHLYLSEIELAKTAKTFNQFRFVLLSKFSFGEALMHKQRPKILFYRQ